MQRLRILGVSLLLFLFALPVISLGASGAGAVLQAAGLVLLVISGALTLSVRFMHGDTCEARHEP